MKAKPATQISLLLVILLLALSLRLGYLTEIIGIMPDSNIFCGGDALAYDTRAQAALVGDWPGDSQFIQVPLYSFYLALIYKVFGVNYLIPLIMQMLLDVLAVGGLYAVGKSVFSPLTGLLAALAVALYGPLISYQVCYAQAPLTTSLLVLLFYFLVKSYNSSQMRYTFVAGIFLGLSVLSRPTMLGLVFVVLIWFFAERKSWPRFVGRSAWFIIALGLVIAPVTLHNYRVTGRIIPISEQGAVNFYFGNNPYSSGIGPHGVADQYGQRIGEGFIFAGEFREVDAKVEAGETTYLEQSFNYISAHPWEWSGLIAKKLYLMFLEPDWKLILSSVVYASSSAALKGSVYLQFFPTEWAALIVCSLLTLVFVRNRYVFLFWSAILAISLVTILFFVKFRFRLPLAPFLLLLSIALTTKGRDWFYQNRRKFVSVLLILLGLFPFEPSLLIFVVLYVAVALFPYRGNASLWPLRWFIAAGWSYLIIVSFILQMLAVYKSNSQIQDYFVGPVLQGPIVIGQSFSPNCDGLYQIQVELSRVSFQHDQPYYFHLIRNLDPEAEIYSTQFEVIDVGKWTYKKFTFPPQTDSKHQSYLFYLQSPTAHPGNSITVRLNPDLPTIYKRYPHGSIYAGNNAQTFQPFPGDLAFAAYCQENLYTLYTRTIEHLSTTHSGIASYPAFYHTILLLHTVLLFIAGWQILIKVE